MREACEVHQGDLRDPVEARQAVGDATHVIHLAAIVGGIGNFHRYPHTLLEMNTGLYNGVFRAALERRGGGAAHPSASGGVAEAPHVPPPPETIPRPPRPPPRPPFS